MTAAGAAVTHDTSSMVDEFGVLAFPTFLSPDECESLRNYATTADTQPSMVGQRDGQSVLKEDFRKGSFTLLGDHEPLILDRLWSVAREVEHQYGVSLSTIDRPKLLVYREGDFFRTHRDRTEGTAHKEIQGRLVSAVMFLDGEDSFGGGELVFYRTDSGRILSESVVIEAGLMVTFPADVVHEVTPVERGVRRTIATWYR